MLKNIKITYRLVHRRCFKDTGNNQGSQFLAQRLLITEMLFGKTLRNHHFVSGSTFGTEYPVRIAADNPEVKDIEKSAICQQCLGCHNILRIAINLFYTNEMYSRLDLGYISDNIRSKRLYLLLGHSELRRFHPYLIDPLLVGEEVIEREIKSHVREHEKRDCNTQ